MKIKVLRGRFECLFVFQHLGSIILERRHISINLIIYVAVLKSEVQHLDSYKVLPWKNNINSFSLKSG
jgi:hypothetical protein